MPALITNPVAQTEQYDTPLRSVLLHLVPGVLIVLFYIAFGLPLAAHLNYPPLFGLLLAVVFVLLPTQLGYLFYKGKQQHGYFTLRNIIQYRKGIPARQLAVQVILLTCWSFFITFALAFVDQWVFNYFFAWVPDWFLLNGSTTTYSRESIIITLVLSIFITGILAPIIEELYFHGYLLPRLAYLGQWAPVISTFLFCLYHFWTPWQIVTRFIYVLPTTYLLWRQQSVMLGIWQHCFGNTLGGCLLLLGALFQQ